MPRTILSEEQKAENKIKANLKYYEKNKLKIANQRKARYDANIDMMRTVAVNRYHARKAERSSETTEVE